MQKLLSFLKKNFIFLLLATGILWIFVQNLIEQFVWETGMAYHMNSVPFIFYIIIFTVLPVDLIEKVYRNKYPSTKQTPYHQQCSSPKDVLKIIFGGILKLGVIIAFPFWIAIATSFLCTFLLKNTINMEETYIFHSDFETLPFASGLGFFFLFVWLFSKKGLIVRDYSDNAITNFFSQGKKANLPFFVKCRIASLGAIVVLLTMLLPACSYDCITEQGVLRRCFLFYKSYTWENADYYSLRSVGKGSLAFLIEMDDGHSVFLDTSLANYLPEETYPNDEYDFFLYLAEVLHKQGVPLQVKDWDKLYTDFAFEEDKEYALKIKNISQNP